MKFSLNFQLLNFKSHFEHVTKFLMFDSKQNSTTTKFSKVELIYDYFVKMIKRCSYVIDDAITNVSIIDITADVLFSFNV